MRTKDEIRSEVLSELSGRGARANARTIEYEVDRRYHWERLVAEAEEYQKKYGSARIEFMATPDNEICRSCWELNGRSFTLEELKQQKYRLGCRCGIVLPADDGNGD
jgi:hypothetical protein